MNRTTLLFFIALVTWMASRSFISAASGAEPATGKPPVSIQALRKEVELARKRTAEFEVLQEKAREVARARAPYTRAAVEHLSRYGALVKARYSDEEGEFTPGAELSAIDSMNVSQLLQSYLRETMPKGRLSAGQAADALKDVVKRLNELADAQEGPSIKNNSELEILAQKIQDQRELIEEKTRAAKELGEKL